LGVHTVPIALGAPELIPGAGACIGPETHLNRVALRIGDRDGKRWVQIYVYRTISWCFCGEYRLRAKCFLTSNAVEGRRIVLVVVACLDPSRGSYCCGEADFVDDAVEIFVAFVSSYPEVIRVFCILVISGCCADGCAVPIPSSTG